MTCPLTGTGGARQLSVAVAVPTVTLALLRHWVVLTFAGAVMTGGVASTTVTLAVHVLDRLPFEAVRVTWGVPSPMLAPWVSVTGGGLPDRSRLTWYVVS